VSGEVEYAFAGPFSILFGPQYIFADPRQNSSVNVKASGAGFYSELGLWVEGRPLRGYFLKAHFDHSSITFKSDIDELKVPQTRVGALFGSQSIYGGWFTISGGVGVVYDLDNDDNRKLRYINPALGGADDYFIGGSGLISGNGFNLITQLALGGSF
jgi:hypothetical protein